MDITLVRNFRLEGGLECDYTPLSGTYSKLIQNIDIEVWCKTPLEVLLLGAAKTDASGLFTMDVEIDSPVPFIEDGKIKDVFLKAYYNGTLLSDNLAPLLEITINEGYCYIGDFNLDITSIEIPVVGPLSIQTIPFPPPKSSLLFYIIFEGQPLSPEYTLTFTLPSGIADETMEVELHTTPQGYVKLDTPIYPVVKKIPDADTVIHYHVSGPLETRAEECYIELDGVDPIYTLITDFVIHGGFLQVFDGDATYYKVVPEIAIGTDISAIRISTQGKVYGYDSLLEAWNLIDQLEFTMFEFPNNLDVLSDGFYTLSGSEGTTVTGTLGSASTSFEDFSGTVTNPEPFLVDLDLEISAPDIDPVSYSFDNMVQGSLNYKPVIYTGDEIAPVDSSPTIDDIETVSGITFSSTFTTFLGVAKIGTLDEARKAGPIRYVEGFPPTGVTPEELYILQGHTDLWSINPDAEQNQVLIDGDYGSIFFIAETPKSKFVEDAMGEGIPLFRAAQIHELAVQNRKLVGNLISGVLTDLKLENGTIPPVSGSTFVSKVLSHSVNSCGCSDCQSNISPFAYLMDLIRYASAHVGHTTEPTHIPGVGTIEGFVTLISDQFLQPFGTLNVDCDTLHNEFCRVRLVTEVLEKWVALETTAGHINATHLANLTQERKQYLLLVYRTILTQAGTSYEELRDIVIKSPADAKLAAAQKLADRLGIPLYVPSTSTLTVTRMWLTFNGGTPPEQELTAVNLEDIFGYRDTQRDVLLNTPPSLMEEWQAAYLRSSWKAQDYAFTNYSREGVLPADGSSYKANWKPVIDPDIIGFTDMTYLYETTLPKTIFTRDLWRLRKEDTDTFLSYCLHDAGNIGRTSADIANRILKVTDRNIVSHVIEDDEIQIKDPVTPFDWIPFTMINRKLVQTDTDVILAKPAPLMFQPNGSTPKMRYRRVLNVVNISGTTSIVLNWPDAVIGDQLSGGYAKLESDGAGNNGPFETNASVGTKLIVSVSFDSTTQVTLTMAVGAEPDAAFLAGNIKFVYEVEVPLYTTLMVDPEKIVTTMFTTTMEYTLLSPAPASLTSPFEYNVWDDPGGWPSPIDPGLTYYKKLKQLYQIISAGNGTQEMFGFIPDFFHMSVAVFNRMMQLLILCENYLASMYTAKRPTEAELYELASIFRNSAKTQFREVWVREEVAYVGPVPGPAYRMMLYGQYFWKSVYEPVAGPWDPSLQTIPDSTDDITPFHVPIIDPELLSPDDMWRYPESTLYWDLYISRQDELAAKYDEFIALTSPYDELAYEVMLNVINTNDTDTPYDISPYASLDDLLSDLNSTDAFRIKEASDVLWSAFRFNKDDFNEFVLIKSAYENADPLQAPSNTNIIKSVRLAVSAYKRRQFYMGPGGETAGWIVKEIQGDFPDGVPVKYYNVLKIRLAPGRTDVVDRRDWQHTLEAWNRLPTIQPDIVAPENINVISSSNWVYQEWVNRRTALIDVATTIDTVFNSSLNAGTLFTNLKALLNSCVARVAYDFGDTDLDYLLYFMDIASREEKDEDIRPYLQQLGIIVEEYRFLMRVYRLLETESAIAPSSPSSLLDTEYTDVTDIFIRIQSVNITFSQIELEYDLGLILDQDFFHIHQSTGLSFPLTDLPKYNQWRSPYSDRKAWLDTLQTRIDREQAVKDKWREVLKETEDRNLPLLRDALIRALTQNCEAWQDAAERLAKTFFIETKDNCCVKHTRISFAIETLQGFLFALENGIYDDFVADYVLVAPNFKREWEWIGSYATWRSAMFVFMYPENLLYPTLKRKQSPKFMELADAMANANSLSSEQACEVGKDYTAYLMDIKELSMVCTTTTKAVIKVEASDPCCGSSSSILETVTYFFGKSRVSPKSYFAMKKHSDPQATFGWWYELSLPKGAYVVGCVALADPHDLLFSDPSLLRLFYAYPDNEKLKLAYLKKDLTTADSDWVEGEEIEIPELVLNNTTYQAQHISICQHGYKWTSPAFSIDYGYYGLDDRIISTYDVPRNELRIVQYSSGQLAKAFAYGNVTNIKIDILSNNLIILGECVVTYTDLPPTTGSPLKVIPLLSSSAQQTGVDINLPNSPDIWIQSLFRCPLQPNTFVVTGFSANYPYSPFAYGVNLQVDNSGNISTSFSSNIANTYLIPSVTPSHTMDYVTERFLYAEFNDGKAAVKLKPAGSPTKITRSEGFVPVPNGVLQKVESADCIANMGIRKTSIQTALDANLNPPVGSALPWAVVPDSVTELINEAYYHLPMLLALDQQRRGQFESALSWYRSVYDYTSSVINNRKIFYGLVLEQFIQNSYERAPDWLLDPLNPHYVAQTRTNAYTKYTLMNIIQCMFDYADRQFTLDTSETVPVARKLYTTAMELLGLPELKVIEDLCESHAVDCLASVVEEPASTQRTWSNLYDELRKKLASLGDAELIESLVDGIADLLNAGDEETYPDKFADAFELIETNRPTPPAVQDVTEMLNGYNARVNEAYQYLSAIEVPAAFNSFAAERYAQAVATISGLPVNEVGDPGSVTQIDWLLQDVPANSSSYTFAFARTDGQQLIPDDDLQFDPIDPRPNPYAANLNYNNAVVVINTEQLGIPVSYSPLIDFVFCMPSNPVYQALRLKGNLELYKIFNCRNIAGMVRELNVYSAATDSVTGMPVIGANGTLSTPAINTFAPSQYRFRILIERAKQIAAQAQQMESLFLAALEKEDATNYEVLRAKQDLETAKATIKLQDLRITQAQDERGIADIQLNKATFTQGHYNNLIASGLLDFERRSLDNLVFAEVLQYIAAGLNVASSVFSFANWADQKLGAVASGLSSLAQASSSTAGALSTQASILSQIASYQRREQEWQFQSQLANFDISLANQQIKISEDGIRIVSQEREIAVLNTTHAENALEFLKNKFTNAELYNFMGNVLERSYSYMLNLSTAIARTAENQLYFERQERSGPFILDDYWVTPPTGASTTATTTDRRGLTGSARLVVDITRLDQYAFDTAKRKLQMTKVISLAQNFPSEFQQFRETGVLNFELTNKLFDYDFPGHYLRLINTVKTTVVGLVPVYDQIKATLTSDATSYTVIGGTTFQKVAIRRAELDSVALTAATNATGLFELQPAQSDFLNPFEGMGIGSRWEFKMPKFSNRMDFSNIADVLITVEYTALDSYQYRYQVLQDLDNTLTFNRGFSFKNNFPDQWFELGEAESGPNEFGVTIDLKRELFPQGIDDLQLNTAENIVLYFVREDGFTSEIEVLDFSKAMNPPSTNLAGGTTVNGKLDSIQLMNTIGNSPVVSLRLLFDNTVANRELFSKGKVTDILLLIPCKANLRSYPL